MKMFLLEMKLVFLCFVHLPFISSTNMLLIRSPCYQPKRGDADFEMVSKTAEHLKLFETSIRGHCSTEVKLQNLKRRD